MIGQHYYTWCPKDVGCEGITGFQTRAKSPSITADIEQIIKHYCSQYRLPRSLSQLGMKSEDLSSDELRSAPIGVHFFAISEDLRGLTRISLHPKQSGRPGNFFAHTLVFPLKMFRLLDFNPFQALRSGIFVDSEGNAGKILDDLSNFPGPRAGDATTTGKVWSNDVVQKVLAGLTVKHSEKRPIILCSSRVEEMASIIEAVLLLLPPEYRASVTFSTYEPDPYRLLTRIEGDAAPSQRIIGTISAEEGGQFQFRDDEYGASCYVFNVYAKRFSDITHSNPAYAILTTEAAQSGDSSKLVGIQELLSTLDLAFSPEKWDSAIPAATLLSTDREMSTNEWKLASQALISSCEGHFQAKSALSLLWSKAGTYLKSMSHAAFEEVAAGCRALLEAARTHVDVAEKKPLETWSSRFRLYFVAAVIIILAIFATRAITISTQEKKAMVLAERLESLERDKHKLTQKIGSSKVRLASLEKENYNLTKEISSNNERLASLEKEKYDIEPELKIGSISGADSRANQIKNALSLEGVKTSIREGGTLVTFEFGLFEEGDSLIARACSVLDELVQKINPFQETVLIEVEGRTDNVPLGENARYVDNYDLGFQRALSVVNHMRKSSNLSISAFSASSAGEKNPLFGNDIVEERVKNRTVVLRITPRP